MIAKRAGFPLAVALAAVVATWACRGRSDTSSGGADSALERVERTESIPPNEERIARLQCPVGAKVLSGGFAGASEWVQVRTSWPADDETWEFRFANSIGMAQEVNISIICAQVSNEE